MIRNADLPVMPGPGTLHQCPIEGCPWTHFEPRRIPDLDEVIAYADPTVRGAQQTLESAKANLLLATTRKVDSIIRTHLAGHTIEDWVATVNGLRAQITRLADGQVTP